MRKLRTLLVTFVLMYICLLPVGAAEGDFVVSLEIGNPIMRVNGIETEIDPNRGTKPIVVDGRTLVPIRAIIEGLGGRVLWIEETETVVLILNDEQIQLNIDEKTALVNGKEKSLDVEPRVINERTMIPVRFVAEGLGLGVAWDDDSQTVFVVKNSFEHEEYERLMKAVPEYFGVARVEINGNKPFFEDYEIIGASFEYYGQLDGIGRCDVGFASVGKDIMPTTPRGSISSVTPTGWQSVVYRGVIDGDYLYNRCHLIAHQLTGENANKRNLITGTRYLNIEGMLPFENKVFDYIEKTGNHVMFRSTPVFSEGNLVADGVLLEGYSVEDKGEGICFCVYCYNVQPGVRVDYSTGDSTFVGTSFDVYRTPSGKRYHSNPDCGGRNSYGTSIEDAQNAGLTPCQKCVK